MRGPNRFVMEDFQVAMGRQGLDGVVTVMPENVCYSSGTLIFTSWEIRDRLTLVVFPNGGEPTLIVCNIEESLARDESWIQDVRVYVEFVESPVDVLADVLVEKGLSDKRVGIELSYLATQYYLRLMERLPKLKLVASGSLFDELRAIKSDEEVAFLKHAANTTEEAIYEAFAAATLGSTEKEIATRMMSHLLSLGADEIAFCVLGVGQNVRHAHNAPSLKQIADGDLVRVDFGGRFDGYCSDVARAAVGGRPTKAQRDLYEVFRQIQRETISQMRPGVAACDVFSYCARVFEERGLVFDMPHIGHSLGIGLHEYPLIEPQNHDELRSGMVINIEPIYVDTGTRTAFHLEDLVHITPDGPVILSDHSDTEELFCIE